MFAVEDGVYIAPRGGLFASTACVTGRSSSSTGDHSLLNDYIKMKQASPRGDQRTSRTRDVIVRALGMKDTVKLSTYPLRATTRRGLYLFCARTDPLQAGDGRGAPPALRGERRLKGAATKLIERANQNGGPDNITVVLARWVS